MSRSPRRISSILVACTLVVGACSSGGDGERYAPPSGPADAARSIHGMLGLVADSDEHAKAVLVSLYGRAEEAVDLNLQGAPGDKRYEMNRLVALTVNSDTGITLQTPESAGGARVQKVLGRLGFWPSDVAAEIQVGERPSMTTVAVGDLDAETVLGRAEKVDGASRSEVGGTDVVSWLDDNEIDQLLDTPLGGLPGQAGRVAVPAEGTLAYTTTDASMADAIDAIGGDRASLAERPSLGPVAAALDDAGVMAAALSDVPITFADIRVGAEERKEVAGTELAPYVAYGIGGALDGDVPTLVLVLNHRDDDAAETNAERLATNVAEGRDLSSGQPWSERLTEPRIEQDGTLVVARFTVEGPELWYRLFTTRASLLATT